MTDLTPLFCQLDDFCRTDTPETPRPQLSNSQRTRQQARGLCLSEILTILIAFH